MSSRSEDSGAATVRWVVYCHLVAVAVCLSFSLADRGMLVNSEVSEAFHGCVPFSLVLFLPSLLAGFVCPAALLVALARRRVSGRSGAFGVFAEILLCITHWWALFPVVA